ncbi:MAG: hypothetical protein NVSMB55_22160 [Mycobacteriales bacterium]
MLSVLMVALLPFAVDVALVLPALPHLLGTRREQPLVAAALPLGMCIALPFAARVVQLRRLLLVGLAIALAGTVVEAFAETAAALLVGRLVVAVGAAGALPAGLRTVRAAFDPAEHVRAVAIWAGFTGLALAAAPFVAGVLVDQHGARAVFLLQLPFLGGGLLAIAAILPALDGELGPARTGGDWAGPAAVFALVATAAGLSYRLQSGWSATDVGLLLLVPAVAFSIAARFGASRFGLVAVALSTVGIAFTASSGLILLVPLGAGAALALSAAPGRPLVRLVAVAFGLAVAVLTPRHTLLAATAISVVALGADLLRSPSCRRSDFAPP